MSDDAEAIREARDRYLAAMDNLSVGVKAKQKLDQTETDPHSLRVGLNSAMIQVSALVQVLIHTGHLTEVDWYRILANVTESEVRLYEQWLSEATGTSVTIQ
jgi:hypothetical protein